MLNPPGPAPESGGGVESATEIERRVLGALCLGAREGSIKDLARSMLAGYHWRDAIHAAIFEIAMAFPSSSAAALKEQLPARLARRGFPDFDVAALFASPPGSTKEAVRWMHRLRELPEDSS